MTLDSDLAFDIRQHPVMQCAEPAAATPAAYDRRVAADAAQGTRRRRRQPRPVNWLFVALSRYFEIPAAVRYYADQRVHAERRRKPLHGNRFASRYGGGARSEDMETDKLLQSELRVVNIGLRGFALDLERCQIAVVHVDWSPPAVRDPRISSLLAKLGG
jgi:hypothetical protein